MLLRPLSHPVVYVLFPDFDHNLANPITGTLYHLCRLSGRLQQC